VQPLIYQHLKYYHHHVDIHIQHTQREKEREREGIDIFASIPRIEFFRVSAIQDFSLMFQRNYEDMNANTQQLFLQSSS